MIKSYHFFKSHLTETEWHYAGLDWIIKLWSDIWGVIFIFKVSMCDVMIVRSPRSTIVYSVFIRPSQLGTSSGPVVTEEYICHKLISPHNSGASGPFYRIAPVMKNQRILFNYSEIAIDFTIFIVMYRARN